MVLEPDSYDNDAVSMIVKTVCVTTESAVLFKETDKYRPNLSRKSAERFLFELERYRTTLNEELQAQLISSIDLNDLERRANEILEKESKE